MSDTSDLVAAKRKRFDPRVADDEMRRRRFTSASPPFVINKYQGGTSTALHSYFSL
jgi:hypothetical protein